MKGALLSHSGLLMDLVMNVEDDEWVICCTDNKTGFSHRDYVLLLQRRTRERLMNVLSLCGPETGIPKNPSVRLLSYSKASDKVSVKSLLRIMLLLLHCLFVDFDIHFCLNSFRCFRNSCILLFDNKECLSLLPFCAGGVLVQ